MKKDELKISIPAKDFPNQLATEAEKQSEEFGLKVGQAIQYEWFRREGENTCAYYNRWIQFHERRLYARGKQSIEQYKNRFKVNGDISQTNMDWRIIPVMPKFVDMIVNGMNDRMFTPKAQAIDATSAEDRQSYQKTIEDDMISKDFLMQTREEFGVDAFNIDPEMVPESSEELELHMQMNYKPKIEIAEEVAMSNILEYNDFDTKRDRWNRDQVELGIGVVKHEYLHGEGVRIKNVDPAYWVHSYTEDPHFGDMFYNGEVVRIPITEIKKINPNITHEELEKIQQTGTAWRDYYPVTRPYEDTIFDKDVVNVLFFNYKTDKRFVFKKKKMSNGGYKTILRDESFNPPEDSEEFSRFDKVRDVWYNGALILGTNILLKWEMESNMVRPDSQLNKVCSNYIAVAPKLYKNTIESPVSRMMPIADMIQLNHLKFQQTLQRMVPDGVFIDLDGLNAIELGDGGSYGPMEAMSMYYQTGSMFGRSLNEDGEFNNARRPIEAIVNNTGITKLEALAATGENYVNQLRDVVGLNKGSDASTPDPKALVGVQKLAALNSNTATRHILNAGIYMLKKLCEGLSLRVSDILQYSEDREEFALQIGKYNVEMLEEIMDLYLHSFGIYIEVSPDEEEIAKLNERINIALQEGSIDLEDSIDIEQVSNIKMANEMLKLRRRKKLERDQQQKQFEMQAQEASNIRSAQAASEARQAQIEAEKQSKIEVVNAEAQKEISVLRFELEAKKELMELEYQYNIGTQSVIAKEKAKQESEKEDRKDARIDKQSTQQSEMITQRQQGGPAKNFESNEDSMDGLGLEEFNPR